MVNAAGCVDLVQDGIPTRERADEQDTVHVLLETSQVEQTSHAPMEKPAGHMYGVTPFPFQGLPPILWPAFLLPAYSVH